MTVLFLEFSGVDDDRRLADMVDAPAADRVRTLDPLSGQADALRPVDEHAASVAADAAGTEVVLGVCSGAALALRVAALLSARTVLVDPFLVDEARVQAEHHALVSKLDGAAGPPPGAAAQPPGTAPAREADLLTRTDRLVEACGGEADLAHYLLRRYAAWLRFLAAAADAGPADAGPVTVLLPAGAELPAGLITGPADVRHYDPDGLRTQVTAALLERSPR